MKITNKYGLPDALVRAVENDPYSKGDCEFSVTELLAPPRQRALIRLHQDEIEEDVSDRLFALYGQIAHLILERANVVDLAEKRFFGVVEGARISAQVDSLMIVDQTLTDWKFTSVSGFYKDKAPKADWVAQLNMQLELLRQNGLDAKKLQIGGLLRDYSKLKQIQPNYPKSPVVIMPIPLWSREETLRFMKHRINAHREAKAGVLPACTSEERWEKPGVWAVIKEGHKRAVKLCETKQEAEEYVQGTDLKLVYRPGESVRCQHYCAAKKFCVQAAQ